MHGAEAWCLRAAHLMMGSSEAVTWRKMRRVFSSGMARRTVARVSMVWQTHTMQACGHQVTCGRSAAVLPSGPGYSQPARSSESAPL